MGVFVPVVRGFVPAPSSRSSNAHLTIKELKLARNRHRRVLARISLVLFYQIYSFRFLSISFKMLQNLSISEFDIHITAKMSVAVEYNKDYQWDWPLQKNDDFVRLIDDATHFEVDLDAKAFTPKEITVKTIGDLLQIQMDHEARGDDSFNISRSITRSYKLPKGVDVKTLKSNLDKNGVLHISAMKS
ncbi:hypothetical protein GCK32_004797 [Trichostrongylus colubriformis]|uniref:SHSP domain-containing protein n=1 Tax=Trichostrongylus colubriformis TaxID=6319 RepID=A0AAN8ESE1_TRICO